MIYFRANQPPVKDNKPCGVVQHDLTNHDREFFNIITIEVQKSLHMNLTVVKFDSIYTGSLHLQCSSYGMGITAVSKGNVRSKLLVCVGDAIFSTLIYSHKAECKIRNLVVDSKLRVALLYQAAVWSPLMFVMPENMLAQSNIQNLTLSGTGNLSSFHNDLIKLSRIRIDVTFEQQINITAYVNKHCTDSIAATKLFDGPILKYDEIICKMNNLLDRTDIVQLFSYLGTSGIIITFLEDTSYSNVHYNVEYKMQEIKAVDVNLAQQERYILNISTKHTDVYQQQWLIKSPYSIKLTMLKNRRFVGYTEHCKYGAFFVKEITKYTYERSFGPFCTSDFGLPLMDGKSWYIGQRSARLTIWAFRGYFDIDIDIAIELTKCEGVNNVYSYLPCR